MRGSSDAARAVADKPGLAARQAAHRLLSAIVDAHTPMDALTDDAHGHPAYLALEARDRALVRAILMAALRHRGDIEDVIAGFVDRPLPPGAASLRAIMHVALAQVLFLDVPDHSAVDLAVASAGADPRNRRFSGLVNALCRHAGRDKDAIRARIAACPAAAPAWFAARLDEVYGAGKAAAIAAVHRQEAPVDLTFADAHPQSLARWAGRLDATVLQTGSLRLAAGTAVTELPGYADGAWWVQDTAATIPARLLGDPAGQTVLDLCAAPGGKTAQLVAAGAEVVALEKSASRLKRLEANMRRLRLADRCTPVHADLFDHAPEAPFARVLLDAPCSSTGTVRRHPDVPWTKSDADIVKLAGLQARMLDRAAGFVAPEGLIVFANCSLDPREGEDVARAFAAARADFEIDPVRPDEVPGLAGCITAEGFVRTTPADLELDAAAPVAGGLDGFFAARFRRTA